MNQPFYKLWSLYIAPLVIFSIFDLTPFTFCSGQHVFINDTQQHTILLPLPTGNTNNGADHRQALQLNKFYVLTLTSDYVVTQTATSYSYSSSTTTVSNNPSPTPINDNGSTSNSSSKDTSILIGSLVGGIGGLFLIGIGLFLFFRNRNGKTDLPTSEYGDNELHRNSHMRAFVPPLPSSSTPTVSLDASSSQQHHQLHGYPYNTSDPLLQQQQQHDTMDDRHVPNEDDQMAGQERHVPHLVD